MKVTNVNRDRVVDFTIPQKGGKPPKVVSIRPGESDDVDLPADDVQIKSLLLAGQIRTTAEAKAPAAAPKPAAS